MVDWCFAGVQDMDVSRTSPTHGRTLGIVAVLALLALAMFSRISGGQDVERVSAGPSKLQGLTVRYAMPSGEFVERSFVGDSQAHWKMLSGAHSGDEGTENVAVQPVSPGLWFVNRVDSLTGETISEVYNLATSTISVYTTRPDPNDPMRRIEQFGSGRLEIVQGVDDESAADRTNLG